jgi:hypothetical protein
MPVVRALRDNLFVNIDRECPWQDLLRLAILAPSPHNVQPWRIALCGEREALLYVDRGRTLPAEDVTGCFLMATMGAFLEALAIAAAQHGMILRYTLGDSPERLVMAFREPVADALLPFARLRLESGAEPNGVAALLRTRRTSRLSYLPKPIPIAATAALETLATQWGHAYEQINDPLAVERILACNTRALFEDLNAREYHDEIVRWFRFSDSTASGSQDGLSYRCMNVPRPLFWITARLPGLLRFRPLVPLLRGIYRGQLGVVPALGVLSGPFFEPRESLQSGRFLLRLWLELARQNLYIHPFGNLVTNQRAAAWLRSETGIANAWLVFKIGFSPEPPASYRRSLQEILVDE